MWAHRNADDARALTASLAFISVVTEVCKSSESARGLRLLKR
jgi:hypothetical protein